tara:strand:- start:242 stop:781 length:540 start_codon:yes stop_codon:yes gene_type:complete
MGRRKRVSDDQAHRMTPHARKRHAFPKYALEDTYKELEWNFGYLLHVLPADIAKHVFSFAKPVVTKIWRAPNVYSPVQFFLKKDAYDVARAVVSVRATVTRVRLHDADALQQEFNDLNHVQRYLFNMNQQEATMTHSCRYTYTASLVMTFRRQEWQREFHTADEAFVEVLNTANECGYK